jgi:hypothetical protein
MWARSTRVHYRFNGQVVAQRTISGSSNTVVYLHGDHLGSIVLSSKTDGSYAVQEYMPWGTTRGIVQTDTKLSFTGQKKDDTGLLFYNARYYDPVLGRFLALSIHRSC